MSKETEDKVLEDKLKDPKFKAEYDKALEESKNFNMDERAAVLLDTHYPKLFKDTLDALAKTKPKALARVLFNEVMSPFKEIQYISKEERELSKLVNQILMAKRQVLGYFEKNKKELEENMKQEKK